MKKLAAAAASTALAVTAIGLGAGPASAADQACAAVGTNGVLCANALSDGYQARYSKTGGQAVVADFNLLCKNGAVYGDYGAFAISAGQTRSYVFKVAAQGECRVRLYDVTNGKYFYTGYIYR